MGELVASWLGPSPKMEEDDSLDPGQVVVTLGADFEHVAEPSTPDDPDSGDAPGSDDSDTTGVDGTGGSELAGGSGGQTSSSSSTTTTTTTPGWTPGVAPERRRLHLSPTSVPGAHRPWMVSGDGGRRRWLRSARLSHL
ncbi:MAG: hypothetical protein R2789_11240 [Microthrixaceae bacterium]